MPGNQELGLFNLAESTGREEYCITLYTAGGGRHTGEGDEQFLSEGTMVAQEQMDADWPEPIQAENCKRVCSR